MSISQPARKVTCALITLPDSGENPHPKITVRREVRKQTCELITLMEMAVPLSSYYLFMEDDFRRAACLLPRTWAG